MKILTKNAMQSGGGTITYYGKLDNGCFYAYFEGTLGIYDADYKNSFSALDPNTWEMCHLVASYDLKKCKEVVELSKEFE